MFERYTEQARRLIFFGRHEASASGSAEITTVHLLLAVLREGGELITPLLPAGSSPETLRSELMAGQSEPRVRVASSVDLPLSLESKRVLAYAAEEADHLEHRHIGVVHLLLGLLRDPTAGSFLNAHGIDREKVLPDVKAGPPETRRRNLVVRPEGIALETSRKFSGYEISVTETVQSGTGPGSVDYSITVRAFGEERSWRTTFEAGTDPRA